MGATAALIGFGGLALGGGFLKAQAIHDQAKAIEDAAEYNAAIARIDARKEEQRIRRIGRRKLSTQRVKFAKAGVRLEGTPLETLAQNAAELERDAVNVWIAGAREAELERARGKYARRAGRIGVGASLLSTATNVAGLGYRLR